MKHVASPLRCAAHRTYATPFAVFAMRRILLSILFAFVALAASNAQNLTLSFKNQPLSEVLSTIRDA